MQSEEEFQKFMETAPVAKITGSDGTTTFLTSGELKEAGLSDKVPAYSSKPIYQESDGAHHYKWTLTPDMSDKRVSVSMDNDSGKITVTVPDTWKDDEQIKKYTDDYMLKALSGNYKANKDIEYQDPYDENKKIKTDEYIKKLNEGLKYRVSALDTYAPSVSYLIARYGGTDSKNRAINRMSADDTIIMNASFDKDDSWVPLPAYMLEAYPELAQLGTYKNGFVQKKDFLENFYNIESGKITEKNAHGISTTPEMMLTKWIEEMDPDQIAKTVAFGDFINKVDPKRNPGSAFLQFWDAQSRGFYGGIYDWFIEVTSIPYGPDDKQHTRDFWNGFLGRLDEGPFDPTEYMKKSMTEMSATNREALSAAQTGYLQGRLSGQAVEMVVSMIALGEATNWASTKVTSKIMSKGTANVAQQMAEATGAPLAKDGVSVISDATGVGKGLDPKLASAISKASSGSAKYKFFFTQTMSEAFNLYSKAVGGTAAMLNAAPSAELANIINSVSKIATSAKYANTAMSVLSSMVFSAVVSNRDLTLKVLSNKATSDEAQSWILQTLFDTAKIGALSWTTNVAGKGANLVYNEAIKGTKLDTVIRNISQAAAQKTSKLYTKISHPWLNFMKWYLNNKAAAGKVSNATASSAEAIKEAVLVNEMRAYGADLSTVPGSYGEKLIEQALDATGMARGVSMSETLRILEEAGVTFDPATLGLSEFEAWQSDFVMAQNALTNWGDVSSNVSQVVHEFTSPDIYPVISQQMSEISKANSKMLELEQKSGLLSAVEAKANKKLLKEDEGYLYALHSPELARYIVRKYELKVITNEARAQGVTDLSAHQPYIDALERFKNASEGLSDELLLVVNEQYIPALTKAEHEIIDVMTDDGVYPRAFVNRTRAEGKFGEDGKDWMRLVARKDLPKGAYNPFSKTVKQDNTLSINSFRILDDDDITWPGNGLQELITEYGIARAEDKLVKATKAATGKTTEVVVSGDKTRSAGTMSELKTEFQKTVKKGFKKFTENVEGTIAIGKKRTAEQKAYFKEVSTTGGVQTIDIDSLRTIMQDKGVPLADTIVDQESLDKFLNESSPEARKILLDVVGEKPLEPELTAEGWGDFWKNASPNTRKILRGELEKTSIETGYGIKDTRARLNSQVPGFDVLDWSLLGREHVNGLYPGGLYSGMDNEVRVYIMDLDDLRQITGLNKNTEDLSGDAIEKIKKDINTDGGEAVIPLHLENTADSLYFYPKTRWGHSGDRLPDWETYFNYLKSKGLSKVPVAINDARSSDFNSVFYQVRNSGIAQKGMDNIVEEIDRVLASGTDPNFDVRDVSAALHLPGMSMGKLRKRIRHSIPSSAEEGVSHIADNKLDVLLDEAERYDWTNDKELQSLIGDVEGVIKSSLDKKVLSYGAPDITVGNFSELLSKYGVEKMRTTLRERGISDDQIAEWIESSSINPLDRMTDITADVQQAFSEYGRIPWFHNQHKPLGSAEFNGEPPVGDLAYTAKDGVGDALWVAPNSSYTNTGEYGKNQTIGTIPTKYFMTDKEMKEAVDKASEELAELHNKITDISREKANSIKPEKRIIQSQDLKDIREYMNEHELYYADDGIDIVDFAGNVYQPLDKVIDGKKVTELVPRGATTTAPSVSWIDYGTSKLTKKEQTKLKKLEKIFSGTSNISYRALAEYTKKPVIDTSMDMNRRGISGTAYFYYKGVNKNFDKEIGKQLETQALFDRKHPKWTEDAIANAMENYDGMSLDEMIDNVTNGEGWGEDWYAALEDFENGTISSSELTEDFQERISGVAKKYPGIAKVMEETWDNNTIQDLRNMEFRYWNPSTGYETINDDIAGQFLDEMGERPPQPSEPIPDGQDVEWTDPTSFENIPTTPKFKQPLRPTYEDYQKGLSADSGLTDTILDSIKGEQFRKLEDFKQKNPTKYEAMINRIDRANSVVNPSVRESQEIQVAAEEFRSNIKDFENTALFTDKFSYMAKAPATKNLLQEFVDKNDLELPTDNRPLKNKVKHALWRKIQNGEELPTIKGLSKKELEPIINSAQGWTSRATNAEPGSVTGGDAKGQLRDVQKRFYKMLDGSDLFRNAGGPNPLKYDLDEEVIYNDIDDAINGMIELVKTDPSANATINSMIEYNGYAPSNARYEFTVLGEILSTEGMELFDDEIKKLAKRIVDGIIPKNQIVIMGNASGLYDKVESAIKDKLESRFSIAKAQLQSMGESAEHETVTELLKRYHSEIKGAESDSLVIKTMDDNGEIQYERVSPALADIYNARPSYSPMGTPMQILNNLALMKKINTTDLSPRSFAKQAVSDPAMAFATVGALPGTLQAMRDEIAFHFGPAALRALEKTDPLRYSNIRQIAIREGITEQEALKRNLEALAKTQVPFTLLNRELLHQANISKFGNEAALKLRRKNVNEKMNGALRKVSDKLGTPQNIRETYVRLLAGEKAFASALEKGYSLEQAEHFREYALNTATTNFRQKHSVFNLLRSTVPYLTSGISGAKSFWKMFELDPIGVTSRIFTGFVIPIMYFTGEIFSDDNLREKYKNLAEWEKENHIVIAVGDELMLIPVGEEMGQYVNIITHMVETLHGENKFDFWNLMLNDLVGLLPGADLTGFTDPEMWEPLSNETPNFLEVMDNGIAKVLSSTMPPIFQSIYMANTGRDLYTGRQINTSYINIDENGKAVIMQKTTSEFAKAMANLVGGDARVIEKIVSGSVGTVSLHILDTLTSAIQFTATGGKEGSLTTGIEKAVSDLSAPFTAHGYDSLEKRWSAGTSALFRKKEEIEKDDRYIKYNQEISREKDAKKRQILMNERNNLFNEYQNKVEALVKGYRDAGGTLDKWKFSTAVSLLTFEDAVRANRQFMDINTDYNDAYKQAMQTLYDMGIKNPDGPSSLGYIYTDDKGNPQLKMWTPAQIQIMQDAFHQQNDIHAARIRAIIDDGTENSLKKLSKKESTAEDEYWNKAKMTNADYDAVDDLRKAFNEKVVLALTDYMDTYSAPTVLSYDAVIDYLNDIIKVPTEYEKVRGRFVSSDNGKLNKQTGFAESYIKTIFGVK